MVARILLTERRRQSRITISDALTDDKLLGAALGDPDSWHVWLSVLRAAFGLGLDRQDRVLFRKVAGNRRPPDHRVSELWAVVGRRSGKTRVAAAIAVFIATLEQHRLAPGEVGYVLLLAMSRDQARIAFDYVVGFLERSPILRKQIESVTADEVRLKGNIAIGVHANSFRTVRGRTLLAVVGDETSFWRDESSAQPDVETFRACVPALAATGGLWVGISTGYRKLGLLYEKWRDCFGKNDNDVLVVQGSTEQFNPKFDRKALKKAMANDPLAAESEWGGGFRADVSAFLDDATIDLAIDKARPLELPYRAGVEYRAFCDASGGRKDHFTIAIGHKESERYICDVIRGARPPFNPQTVVAEFAALLKDYKVSRCRGDNYSAAWVEQAWHDQNILYDKSEVNKSGLYLESLPTWVRGLVSIPDYNRLTRELRLLERSPHRGGKDTVDHPRRNGSDDYANSVCGLLHSLTTKLKYPRYDSTFAWVNGDDEAGTGTNALMQKMHQMVAQRRFTW